MTKSLRGIYDQPLFVGRSDVRTFGRSDVRTFGHSKVQTLDVRTFERSNIGRWTLALDVDVGRFTLEVGR